MTGGVIVLAAIMLASVTLSACGFIRTSQQNTLTPTSTHIATSDWGSSLDTAWGLHRAGEFYAAIDEYDKTLESLPLDDSTLAVVAGVNISKGEAYLPIGNGVGAVDASLEANTLLEQATQYEKQSTSWQLMMGQAMTVAAAGLLYMSIEQGEQVDKAIDGLREVANLADLPEIHFFLGIGYAELGMSASAKREFEVFLEEPDIFVTFLGKNTMRQLARSWMEKL